MANTMYTGGKQLFLNPGYDWATATIKVSLLNASYTPSVSDTTYSSISSNALTGLTPQTIGSPTATAGVASGNSVTFTGVASGQTAQTVVIYDTGGTLIAWFDTWATTHPLTTTGADITVNWNNTPTAGNILAL